MTNSFFSNPEDELTVEELKSLGKLIPKIPGPKRWDTKYAPGRGEGRAAFAKSKRNLDAMLQRDALRAENKGNVGIGGTPQTRDHSWFDGGNNYASQPGTGQFIRLPKDMQTTTAEDQGNLAVINASKGNKLGSGSSVGETNYRASLTKAASGQSSSKGSVGKNLLTLQEMRNEQNPVAQASATTTNNVESVQTQSQAPTTPKMNLNLKSLDEASATRIGNMQSLFNNASPERLEQLRNNPRMAEDLLRDAGKGIGVGGGEAAGLGAAGGMQIAGKVLQMLDPKGGKEWTEPVANVNTSKKGRFEYDPFALNMYTL